MFRLFSKKSNITNLSLERYNQLKQHAEQNNIPIKDFDQWDLALTHISYGSPPSNLSYERLEFLGDSVLGLCVASILFQEYPDLSEGKMSALKSNLADEKTLSEIGKNLDFLSIVKLGRGEKLNDQRAQEKVLCDLFESTVASIFLDYGFQKCRDFIFSIFHDRIDLTLTEGVKDYKTRLQKIVVRTFKTYPHYQVVNTEGPDHGKIFTVEASVDQFFASGKGRSKKEAEQNVAKDILEQMEEHVKNNPDSIIVKELYMD